MRKKIVLLATLIAMTAIIAAMFVACDSATQQTGAKLLEQQYNEISSASSIEQKIEITKNGLTQFESNKTYDKTSDGYDITGTEKKLNDLDADKPYDEKTIDEHVQKATDVKPTLKLDESYFQEGYRLTDAGLTANVKQGNIKDVFGITGELKAPTDNLRLELSVTGGKVKEVRINYDSNGSHVEITLSMTY